MNFESCTRRNFLSASLAAAALSKLPGVPLLAKTVSEKADSSGRKLFLFVDWFHVQKGELKPTLDPQRISDTGKKLLETYEHDFGRKFDQSGHGFKSDSPSGIRITPEIAEHSKPWLAADQHWEQSVGSPTVLFENGKYRCWYIARLRGEPEKTTVDQERVMNVSGSALAYAESVDGMIWKKPSLQILSYNGSRDNNLVSPFNSGGAIFRDDHGPAEERYKGFQFAELPKEEVAKGAGAQARYGLFGITSPDGYHWTRNPKPLIKYFADTTNIAAWDPLLEKYVGYFRHHLSGRTISRAETADFWNWPEPTPLRYAGPMDSPADDYYTNCYTTYPNEPALRLIFPAIYHHDSDKVDVRLGVSRDGRAYQWVSCDPIIKLGAAGEWDCGSIYAEPQLVQLPDGRLALPYGGFSTTHNEAWFKTFYNEYEGKSGIAWALWKDARLAGIEAEKEGQFAMISTPFDGKQIEVNARTTSAGSVLVELRRGGNPIDGFTFENSEPISGDELWAPCRWKNGQKLPTCAVSQSKSAFAYAARKFSHADSRNEK